MFHKWKFKFFIWVLGWSFIKNHIEKAEARAVDRGRHQERIHFLTEIATHCNLQWPKVPDRQFVDLLKRLWVNNYGNFAVMFPLPVSPVENGEGQFTGYTYTPNVDLDKMKWVLGAILITKLPAFTENLKNG